jgi:hypothetical protein
MQNPFKLPEDSGSYINLQNRMLQKVETANVRDQILAMIGKTFEDALQTENIVLSGPERKRLLKQITKSVLEDLLK